MRIEYRSVTSHFHDNGFVGDKQGESNMAALMITAFASFFHDEPNSITRGENHYSSSHIQSFSYSNSTLRGIVKVSMKNTRSNVTVR